MNYGNILTTTWKTLWKDKAIIGFGSLMMIAPALIGLFAGVGMALTSPNALESFFESDLAGVGVLFLLLGYFILIAASIFLSALSFAGTMKGVLLAEERNEPLTFGEIWEASLPYFWRMLGVIFSVGFVLMLLYFVPLLIMVFVGALTAGIGFLCALPLLLLLLPLGVIGYLTLSMSMAALIVEDGGVFESIQRAWDVVKAKFWPLILMTVILYFIQMGIGIVIAVPLNLLQFAFILPMQSGDIAPETLFRYLGILFAIVMPLSSLLQGFVLTYVNGAWVFSYREAAQPAPDKDTPENDRIEYAS
jgi:hypothetical protein